jgi:hypothetical protein
VNESLDEPGRRAADVKVDCLNHRDDHTNWNGQRLRRGRREYRRARQNGVVWMVDRRLAMMPAMVFRHVADRVRLRVLVQDDPCVTVGLSLVSMLRRHQGHKYKDGHQNQ